MPYKAGNWYILMHEQYFSKQHFLDICRCAFEVGFFPFRKKCICFNDSSLKMMKNAFYFILKALSVLKIFKFLSWLFGHLEKTAWLERKAKFQNLWHNSLVNKLITIYILPNISQSKDNQTIGVGGMSEVLQILPLGILPQRLHHNNTDFLKK